MSWSKTFKGKQLLDDKLVYKLAGLDTSTHSDNMSAKQGKNDLKKKKPTSKASHFLIHSFTNESLGQITW